MRRSARAAPVNRALHNLASHCFSVISTEVENMAWGEAAGWTALPVWENGRAFRENASQISYYLPSLPAGSELQMIIASQQSTSRTCVAALSERRIISAALGRDISHY